MKFEEEFSPLKKTANFDFKEINSYPSIKTTMKNEESKQMLVSSDLTS